MSDISCLYYTARKINPTLSAEVRGVLLPAFSQAIGRCIPSDRLISVSHGALINMGTNINVGYDVQPSIWQCYQNVLIGARAARTKWIACAEDDTCYVKEHFEYRPSSDDAFAFNEHRYVLTPRRVNGQTEYVFYFRRRTQLAMMICARDLLVETLEQRFARWPNPITDAEAKAAAWGEPGRYEKNMGLPVRKREYFRTTQPCVTVNHQHGLMGPRKIQPTDTICTELEPWGTAAELWERLRP